MFLKKAGKAIDNKNVEFATKDHQIQYLQTQLESQKPKGKRKVKEEGNNKFARVNEIIKAREESKQQPKRKKVTKATQEVNPLQEVQQAIVHTLQVIEK